MEHLIVQLLGDLRVYRRGGLDAASAGRKAQALLAYLALNPKQRCTRDRLATLLWSDRGEEQARHSLRQAVLALRKALDDESASILLSDGERLTLSPEAIEVDVQKFERLAAANTREALEQAKALYIGDFLEGIDVRSEAFDEWMVAERTRLRDLATDVLQRLTQICVESRDWDAALAAARHLLTIDPLHEEGHRALMRIYDCTGHRSLALRQYRICEEALKRELDAVPTAETQRLFSEIRGRSEEGADTAPAMTSTSSRVSDPTYTLPAGTQAERVATPAAPWRHGRWLWPAAAAAGVAAILALSALYLRSDTSPTVADTAKMAFPLPDKPSIAILPFESLNDDRTQDNLVEALTADVTTALSIASGMFVIDRNSTLVYRGKPVKPRQVAEELGVRYVLLGSVQRSGDRVRISVELIDALGGRRLWADRYDREVKDLFALQDEITLAIITALQVHLTEGEQERISLIHGTHDLRAWMLAGHGLQLLRHLTRDDTARARELYREAVAVDPNYPGALDGLAWSFLLAARFGWSDSPETDLKTAAELAQKALALDPMRPRTYALLGAMSLTMGDHAQAIAYGEKAVVLDPNGAEIAVLLALTLTYTGDAERGIDLVTKAMRLSPYYPDWYRWVLGRAYRLSGRYREAEAVLATPQDGGSESVWPLVELAATYGETARLAEARTVVARILKIDPTFSVLAWTKAPAYRDPAMNKREIDSLRRAGLPA